MTVLALIGLGVWVGEARADKAQLAERLRQELTIQLEDVTITQALEQIGQKAGVKITLSPEAAWKLPEGEQTRLSVTLEGRLAESLEKMLNSFFLRYAVGSDSLTIHPRPELKHIIGRPTAAELKLLINAYGSRMWISGVFPSQRLITILMGQPVAVVPADDYARMDRIISEADSKWRSSGDPHDPNVPRGAPLTVALLLDGIEHSGPDSRTWYLQGQAFPRQVPEIRIVPKEEFWRAQLDQVVDVSFSGEKGDSVVRKLAAGAGLDVQVSDVVTQHWLDQEVALEAQNVRLADALDKALFSLGVERELNDGVLRLYCKTPEKPTSEPPQPAAGDPQGGSGYVGKISIPMDGGRYFIEFMLRESDLPEELRKLRQQAMNEVIEELSREGKMKEVLKRLSSEPVQK